MSVKMFRCFQKNVRSASDRGPLLNISEQNLYWAQLHIDQTVFNANRGTLELLSRSQGEVKVVGCLRQSYGASGNVI